MGKTLGRENAHSEWNEGDVPFHRGASDSLGGFVLATLCSSRPQGPPAEGVLRERALDRDPLDERAYRRCAGGPRKRDLHQK